MFDGSGAPEATRYEIGTNFGSCRVAWRESCSKRFPSVPSGVGITRIYEKCFLPMHPFALSALFSAVSNAQCADGFNPVTFNCAYSDQCASQVTVWEPNESQNGVLINCGSTSCCGQLFTSCWGQGGCQNDNLKGREVNERLTELSRTSEVLVADCKGRYALYTPPPTKERSSASWALLNDHVLLR
jgi:hypothetical protein